MSHSQAVHPAALLRRLLRAQLRLKVMAGVVVVTLVALVAFAGLLAPLGVGLFAYALRRARIDGSLSHY